MFPMDFEEFLWAAGDDMTMPFVMECFEKRIPLGPLHRKVMDLFRQYMIVGGMPQAVLAFFENRSFEDADIAKRELPSAHRDACERLSSQLKTKVEVSRNLKGRGSLTIRFRSDEEFERIMSLLQEKG